MNNLPLLKACCHNMFQTSNILNVTKNYLIKDCFDQSFLSRK